MVSVCGKRLKKKRQKMAVFMTAGGDVFAMAGFGAGLIKWLPNRAASGVIECLATVMTRGQLRHGVGAALRCVL